MYSNKKRAMEARTNSESDKRGKRWRSIYKQKQINRQAVELQQEEKHKTAKEQKKRKVRRSKKIKNTPKAFKVFTRMREN